MGKARRFDAIVVGAGHNGLVLAAYLARAGLATLVVERAAGVGGMTATTEPLLPGFRHNPHANYLCYQEVTPLVAELELERHGLRTAMPAAQHGIAFPDGGPPAILYRPDLADRTHASLARHSRQDADTYVALKRRAAGLAGVIGRGIYAPPSSAWFAAQAAAVEEAYGDLGITAGIATKTAAALIDELFESDAVRALMYQVTAEFGAGLDEPGGAFALLGFQLWMAANWRLPLGGMATVATALRAACLEAGVEVMTAAEVERVVIANDRATGVEVKGVGEIAADRLVASSASLATTMLGLVGAERLDAETASSLRAFAARPASALASLMFCLREPPAYGSARWEAEIDRCFHTVVGFAGAADTLAYFREVEAGLLPAPAGAARVNTLWDPSQAPPGRHVAGVDCFFPAPGSLSADGWEEVAASYNRAFVERWAEFAPNVTDDNVLADDFRLDADYERKLLLRSGAAQYRTAVPGLYVCGASTYPGGGVHGACGHNAYTVIAADLGLPEAAGTARGRE